MELDSVFEFSQFIIFHNKKIAKVGTDAVLLGSLFETENGSSILDIGTGSGVLALICQQRFPYCQILGIDISEEAIQVARKNFSESSFEKKPSAIHISFNDFVASHHGLKFDGIICNPPYHVQSLRSGNAARDTWRHNQSLPFVDLFCGVKKILVSNGRFWLISPFDINKIICRIAISQKLYLVREWLVYTKREDKYPTRWISVWSSTYSKLNSNKLNFYCDKLRYDLMKWNNSGQG